MDGGTVSLSTTWRLLRSGPRGGHVWTNERGHLYHGPRPPEPGSPGEHAAARTAAKRAAKRAAGAAEHTSPTSRGRRRSFNHVLATIGDEVDVAYSSVPHVEGRDGYYLHQFVRATNLAQIEGRSFADKLLAFRRLSDHAKIMTARLRRNLDAYGWDAGRRHPGLYYLREIARYADSGIDAMRREARRRRRETRGRSVVGGGIDLSLATFLAATADEGGSQADAAPPPDDSSTLPAGPHSHAAELFADEIIEHLHLLGHDLAERLRADLLDAIDDVVPPSADDPDTMARVRAVMDHYGPELYGLFDDLTFASLLGGVQRVASLLPPGLLATPSGAAAPAALPRGREREARREARREAIPAAPAAPAAPTAPAPPPPVTPTGRQRHFPVSTPHGGDVDEAIEGVEAPAAAAAEPVAFVAVSPPPPRQPPGPPVEVAPSPAEPLPPRRRLPLIDAAVEDLRDRKVMTRPDFDELSAEAKRRAFTVAGHESAKTVEKVRDVLADLVAEGPTLKKFGERAEERVGPGTFLSPQHREVVYRTNIHSAYTQGMDNLLEQPLVGDAFPFAAVHATHDDRVRPEHLAMETLGLDGGNVYYRQDPVFKIFRGPWSWNCRCGWTPLSIRQAARMGVSDAIAWLASGVPPDPPTFVEHPPFDPPEGWSRGGPPIEPPATAAPSAAAPPSPSPVGGS